MSSLRPSGRKTDITSYRPDASRIAAESSPLAFNRMASDPQCPREGSGGAKYNLLEGNPKFAAAGSPPDPMARTLSRLG